MSASRVCRTSPATRPSAGPSSGTVGRPSRRAHWESSRTPSPATLNVPVLVVPSRASKAASRSTSRASSSWTNWSRGSCPSTVGSTGSAKYSLSGVLSHLSGPDGPRMLAKRSTVTATSGRRRAKPRTYPSTSVASLAKPPFGRFLGCIRSPNTAGSRGAEPYTPVVDFTTTQRSPGAFWQAPSSCIVPMTLRSLTAARPPGPLALTSRCTTVSTSCSAISRAMAGRRRSTWTKWYPARAASAAGWASTPITRSMSGRLLIPAAKRAPSRRATPVTSTTLPTLLHPPRPGPG